MVGDPKPEHPLPPRRLPLSRRQLLMQMVVAVVILGSGMGIGTGGTVLALKNRIVTGVRWLPVGPPGPEPNEIAARWKTEYGLSDKQEQQVKEILTKQFTALRELRQKLFQAEQSEREKSTASLKKVLTAEQYAKWDQDMQERTKRFERMRAYRASRGDHKGPPHGDRGPGRPMDPNGWRRGNWSPRGPMDPNNRPKDHPADQAVQLSPKPNDANAPK